jgi:hypothetical protein
MPCALKLRTLSPVVASHTLQRMLRLALNTRRPSLDHASAVMGSVSPSRVCATAPVDRDLHSRMTFDENIPYE